MMAEDATDPALYPLFDRALAGGRRKGRNVLTKAWKPRDKSGFTFFEGQNGELTRFPRYTDLDFQGQPPVRVLHGGWSLSQDQKADLRLVVGTARGRVDKAIVAVQTGIMDDESRALIRQCFNADFEKINPSKMNVVEAGLKKMADGLYSPELEIKFYNTLSIDDDGHASKIQRAPHRERNGFGQLGVYHDEDPRVSVKLAANDVEKSVRALIGSVARNAANLDRATGLRPVDLQRRPPSYRTAQSAPVPPQQTETGVSPVPAMDRSLAGQRANRASRQKILVSQLSPENQRIRENVMLLHKQLMDLKKLDPKMPLNEFTDLAVTVREKARLASENGQLSEKAFDIAAGYTAKLVKERCDQIARQFVGRDDREKARSR